MTPRYLTKSVEHPNAWYRISPGIEVTLEPLRDCDTGLYAHVTYAMLRGFAENIGARIIAPERVRLIAATGFVVTPTILPTADMLPPRRPGETERNYQIRIREPMGGREWCDIHDRAVMHKLAAWDRSRPVLNAGKWWVAGAPRGRAYLMGWFDGRRWIQPAPALGSQGPHNDQHSDYATLSMLERSV